MSTQEHHPERHYRPHSERVEMTIPLEIATEPHFGKYHESLCAGTARISSAIKDPKGIGSRTNS